MHAGFCDRIERNSPSDKRTSDYLYRHKFGCSLSDLSEALEAVTTFDFQVAPTIYSSISDIKKYAQQSSNRVLCERTLYTPDAVQYENIIPISINTIDRAIISVQNK